MKYDKSDHFDYIYKDENDKKCIGEVTDVVITPYYQFTIKIKNRDVWCHLDHILNEWHIHFIELETGTELAHPRDVIWNTEALYVLFKDIGISRRIAYAIKTMYERSM